MRNVFFIRNSIEEIDWEFLFVTAFHFWSLWLVNGERFVPMLAPFAFHSQSSSSIHFCNLIEMFRLFAYFFIAKLCTKNFLFQFDRRLLLYERSYSSIFFSFSHSSSSSATGSCFFSVIFSCSLCVIERKQMEVKIVSLNEMCQAVWNNGNGCRLTVTTVPCLIVWSLHLNMLNYRSCRVMICKYASYASI